MDNIEEIKKRIDIVEFINQYLELKRMGINYSSRCPFHNEKSPSFMVSPERQSFKCFGCGEGGDVITFYQKMEGLSFPEAIRMLGERVGVQVEFKNKEEFDRKKSEKDIILKVNLISAKYYKAILWSKAGEKALAYLKRRGLSKEIIEKFKIGYAPAENKLIEQFRKYSITESNAQSAGNPQRFKYRIVFPIFDSVGQIIGFSGRILEEEVPEGISPHPKYLNTPETLVFHKSQILYGLNFAKEGIRKNKRVLVVEGQMDVVMSHQAKVEEVVASSGTAFTSEHLKILGRYCPKIIFSFDEDEAGQKAADSAIKMALDQGLDISLTKLPNDYKDIGELALKEPEVLEKVIIQAKPPIEWLIQKYPKNMEVGDKKEAVAKALSYISLMKDEIEKAHYLSFIAKAVGVPAISVEKALDKFVNKKPEAEQKEKQYQERQERDVELEILSVALNQKEFFQKIVQSSNLPFENKVYAEVYKQVQGCYNKPDQVSCLSQIAKKIDRELYEKLEVLALVWDNKINENNSEAAAEFISIVALIQKKANEAVKNNFAHLISQAEKDGNLDEVKRLMQELQKSLNNKVEENG